MIDLFGPYALPTAKASKRLAERLKEPWAVPFPANDAEAHDFKAFAERHNVVIADIAPLFGEWEADRDLCPYVFAWRYLRGELVFTPLGQNQYANKRPFRDTDIDVLGESHGKPVHQ